jgi:hypothetical protein
VVWSLVQSRLDGHDGDLADVRRHVDRFVLPALTGRPA